MLLKEGYLYGCHDLITFCIIQIITSMDSELVFEIFCSKIQCGISSDSNTK